MEQNLGNLERTLLAPEKLRREKPLWQDILIGFVTILIPMLIVGWMVAGLMEGAGLTRTFGWILTAMVIAVLTPFAVFVARRQTSSLIRQRLELRERGVSGVCMLNALRTREFSIPYGDWEPSPDGRPASHCRRGRSGSTCRWRTPRPWPRRFCSAGAEGSA